MDKPPAEGQSISGSDPAPEGTSSIGEMARTYKVSQRTLRFYEHRGLLAPRRDGTTRLYGPGDRLRLEAILRGKRLGFTLTEITRIVDRPGPSALERERIALQIAHFERQRDELTAAISDLRGMLATVDGA